MKESRHFPPFVLSFHRSPPFENPSIIYSSDKGDQLFEFIASWNTGDEIFILERSIDANILFRIDVITLSFVKNFFQSSKNLFNFEKSYACGPSPLSRVIINFRPDCRTNFATELDFPFLFILVFHERRSITAIINDARF